MVNEVHGGAYAIVQNSTVSGDSLAVTAVNNAAINATLNATATSSASSSFSSMALAINASISINEILGNADAHVIDSTVSTSSGDVNVIATNSADIEASTMSAVSASGGGTSVAVGVIMAANTIGAGFQNLLDSAVDTIAGGNVLGTSAPTETTAYIKDSSVDAGGALNVVSTSTEIVNATVGNTTLADIQPSDSARSTSAGAVLSTNQILTTVTAYIDNDSTGDTVSSGGATAVSATDTAGITTSTTMTALGTPAAGGAADDYAGMALSTYKYTNKSTNSATLKFGDQIAVQDPTSGSITVYRYLGSGASNVNLTSTDFTNLDVWKPLSADQLKEEAKAQSANPKSGDEQGGTPGESITKPATAPPSGFSASLYVLFDYNNVASSTAAYIQNATVTGGTGVAVTANDTASITATDGSVVTTNAGGFGAGGVVATNHVTGSIIPSDPGLPLDAATASISNATVEATTGGVALDAESNGTITATETTALTADGNAVSIEAGFNVIGWSNDNFGSLALAALIGTDQLLGTATPYATQAYITDGSGVTADAGDVTVTANGKATITATVGDQAAAGNGDATATLNVGGVLATNKINTSTDAYIGTAAPPQPTNPFAATSSVSGTVLTVTSVSSGTLKVGATVSGTGIAAGTTIVSQTNGTAGGAGTYQLSASQPVTTEAISNAAGTFAGIGSVLGNVLTIASVDAGTLSVGSTISGNGIAPGTTIVSAISGTGGVGTYRLSSTQPTTSETVTGSLATASATIAGTLDTSHVRATLGSVKVSATDNPTLSATSTMTLSSTASAGGTASALSGDYKYTEQSGTQTLSNGDQVRVKNGTSVNVYTYTGADGSVDLGPLAQYTVTGSGAKWAPAKTDGSASTDSSNAESKAIGFNFVLNDVRGDAMATIATTGLVSGGATINSNTPGAGGISVTANEAASITADTESNLTSTGGGNGSQSSTGGSKAPDANTTDDASNQPQDGKSTDGASTVTPGGGLALGGAVVTNLVLAQSQASIQGATVGAGRAGIIVDAQDTAQLDAKTIVASSTGGAGSQKDFDLAIAFNSIGYAPENFLFNAVDAMLGSDYLSDPTPDNATAFISGVLIPDNSNNPDNVGDLGDLSVTAESNEQVNATVSNAASSTTSALFDASSTGFGGVLASNKVNGSAVAFIDESGISGTAHPIDIAGALTVSATDGSAIYSNVKLVSAAIVTDDGSGGGFNTGLSTPPTFTALGDTPTGFNNPQDLVTGNTVQLDAAYDTPKFTVGTDTTVDLATGDVIDKAGTLYRYIGSGQDGLSLASANFSDTSNFVQVGGTSGDTYTYIGSGATQVDLANTDYTDTSNWKLASNSFTALATGNAPFSNTQTVSFGDTVTLDPGYDTPDFTVNATGESTVNLRNGDVIDDGGALYRFNSTTPQNGFTLTDDAIKNGSLKNDFTIIGGTGGATYEYMGSSSNGTPIDLANTNYTNLGFWKLVTTNAAPAGVKTSPAPNTFTALGSTPSGFSNSQSVAPSDTVTLDENYDDPTYTVGSSNPASTTLKKGDVIDDGGTLYRYTASGGDFDLKDGSQITGGDFTVIGGDDGATYTYKGTSTQTIDLANTDYTGSDWEKQESTGGAETEGTATNDSTPAANASNATAVGGILVLNDDRSATHAYVLNATITAATATVSAIDNATIQATNDSTVTAQSSSLGSNSNNIAVNGIIATNLIQNSATAEVNTSSITTTGAGPANTDGSPNGPVSLSIYAENNANISASNAANTSGANKSAGIVLAFNTIGLQSSNFLFNAVDALLGNNVVTAAFGDSPQTNTTADAHDSTLIAEDGSISITAFQVAKINAITTNSTTSLGAALENASAVAIGAILATNQTNSFALAYADGGSTLSATGDVGIQASDRSQINAINTEIASAVLQTQATTKPSLFTGYLDQLKQGYQYTSNSGSQTISAGTIVYDDPVSDTTGLNGTYYVYLGSVDQHGLNTGPEAVDLGATNYTIGLNAGQFINNTPQAEWLEFTNSSLLADLPDFATVKATGDTKGTGSSSTAVGAIFVLNTINASVDAHASTSTLDSGVGATTGFGGGVTIQATNLSTINATNTSTVTASDGQTGPTVSSPGTGLAVNATIATNNILSSTQAYSSGGSITALGTGGSIDITATSNDTINAENDATTDAKTTSVGVVLAFNTIGIKQPVAGFLENTVDALFGTDLAGEQPDQVYAYMSGTTANASDGIDVAATDSATITAKIDNAETGLFSSGTSVAATVTLNRIATDVEAWISGGSATATAGDIDITGQDAAAITSTVLSPVVKLAVDFSAQGSGPQNATTIGISIARNIIDNTLDAEAGLAPSGHTSAGTTLHAEDGSIDINASQTATIAATSASAAISVAANKSGNSGGFAGGGAVAINTITGGVVAESASSGLTASGAIGVNATYGGSITSTVAALAATLAASEGASDAVAIGAAVSLNLIGWRGTVADETQDSNNPITLSAKVSGGTLSAGSAVSVTASSTTTIDATTVAAAVAIGISAGSSGSGSEPTTGGTPTSPTDANVEGKGSNPGAEGQELSPTDSGASSTPTGLSMLDEGSDVKGSGGVDFDRAGRHHGGRGQRRILHGDEGSKQLVQQPQPDGSRRLYREQDRDPRCGVDRECHQCLQRNRRFRASHGQRADQFTGRRRRGLRRPFGRRKRK